MPPTRGRQAAIAAAQAISSTIGGTKRPLTSSSGTTVSVNTANNKAKQLVVRLEKVPEKNKELQKKPSIGIIAKRTTRSVASPTPPPPAKKARKSDDIIKEQDKSSDKKLIQKSQQQQQQQQQQQHKIQSNKKPEEDLSNYNLATARTRRTPKPNPKYTSEDIITSYSKNAKTEDTEEELSGEDFDSADDFEVNSLDEEQFFDSEEDELEELVAAVTGSEYKRSSRASQQQKTSTEQNSLQRLRTETRSGAKVIERATSNVGIKRKLEGTPVMQQTKRIHVDNNDKSTKSTPINQKVTGKQQTELDNRRVTLLRPIMRSIQQRQNQQITMKKSQETTASRASSATTMNLREKKANTSSVITSPMAESTPKRDILQKNDNIDDIKVELKANTSGTTTLDDFETMPTFTIVNINDIMNKKNDKDETKATRSSPQSQRDQNRNRVINTILSDSKVTLNRNASPPSPTKRTTTLNNNVTNVSLKSSQRSGIETRSKPPPRILNSVIGKKTRPISPVISAKNVTSVTANKTTPKSFTMKAPTAPQRANQTRQQAQQQQQQQKSKENAASSLMKTSPVLVARQTSATKPPQAKSPPPPSTLIKTNKTLPKERVTVQRQGNKIVRKVTCYETWYVVNFPKDMEKSNKDNDGDKYFKNTFDMPLVELGNNIKDVQIPEGWNYKITLQKLLQSDMEKPDFIPYTGELNEKNIPDEDKKKFQPVTIMFRRQNANQVGKNAIPFDRAIIFKNDAYIINIEGKNVRLLGAPTVIKTIEEISILLDVVTDLTLKSTDYVELTSYNL